MEKKEVKRFFKSIKDWLTPYLKPETPFLLACSAGKDSMLLAHVLLELKIEFALIHINYGWREESDDDQQWLENWAEQNQIPIHIYKAQSKSELLASFPGKSAQEIARIIRYRYFSSLSASNRNAWVLTAHHLGDQRETLFMRILEGRAVNPIPQVRKPFLRPLLNAAPDFLEKLRAALHVSWREDSSNASLDYRRNQLRHQIIPQLNQLPFNWKVGFDLFIQHHTNAVLAEKQWIEQLKSQMLIESGLIVFPVALLEKHTSMLSLLFRAFEIQLSEKELPQIVRLLSAQKGKKMLLANGVLWREKHAFVFVSNDLSTKQIVSYPKDFSHHFHRKWKPGDYLTKPDGHSRKLSDWLTDHAMPSFLKPEFLVILDKEKMIWPQYHSKLELQLTSAFLELVS